MYQSDKTFEVVILVVYISLKSARIQLLSGAADCLFQEDSHALRSRSRLILQRVSGGINRKRPRSLVRH